MEKCQRCGETGRDLRTLWMACLYAMSDLKLPFERCALDGKFLEHNGDTQSLIGAIPKWKPVKGSDGIREFYTLRVCKGCRAEWMTAIKSWFENPPWPADKEVGTGLYERHLGATREVTRLRKKKSRK